MPYSIKEILSDLKRGSKQMNNNDIQRYSIGEVSKITGISRDRLRNYEKLGIIEPQREEGNQYRFYTEGEIDRILALELYRAAELQLPTISKICSDSTVEDISLYLKENEKSIEKQMKHLALLQSRTKEMLHSCEIIEKHLNKISVTNIQPYEVIAEMDDYRSYQEYAKLFELGEDERPIVFKMQRRILFNQNGIYSNKMVITKPVNESVEQKKQRCVYTVVQDGENGENPLMDTFNKCMCYCEENQLKPTGEVFVGMLLLHCRNGKIQSYLEIKGPIE